ncbi:hypothetical protein FEM48_Zijuj04G0104600 [Ziziphus jujuba var. spinosa]|uniref:Uncharacterized protein n=1 Tax=Ziziphus jujuba var. spinosa TaxID=714518 RepID=A0A978VJC8_ZIZJJ|nr:hypothetical protein FEM48_Zijuj04G0104600 [Ziziphus jujuba var. spinosa]
MLKNLMEDKQLDFNQPFLSVRRFSSTVVSSEADERKKADKSIPKLPPLPVYKSELKSGPVRHPGAVPFLWEQTPGRPKDENNSQTKAPEQRLLAPRLPPGRVSNVKQQASDKGSKGTAATRSHNGNFLSSSQDVSNLDEKNATLYESSKEGTQDKGSSGSDDGDEAYLDALDTLSRSESSYMNCSVSGVSGLDGPNVKPSGIFSTDPQTQDFMMGRFLPAAKAMASETPQYGTRRQLVAREQSRQVKTVPSEEKRHPLNQYRPNAFPRYAQEIYEEGSEYGADDYDGSENISATVCGLFPRFCLKNSFCLLNPVPGMKMQAQLPVSSVYRMQTKSSCAGSRGETEKKCAGEPVREQRSMNRQQAVIEFQCNSKHIVEKNDCQKLDGSSLYRRLQGNGLLSCQNGYSQPSIPEEKGILVIPENAKNHRANGFDMHRKGPKNFRELLTIENTEWELQSGSPVVEKTVYVDSVHTEKSRNLNSSSLDMKGFTDFCGNDLDIPGKGSDMKENISIDSSVQDIQHLIVVNEKAIIQPKSLESFDSCSMSFSDRSTRDIEIGMKNCSRHHEDLIQDYIALKNSKVADQENFDPERKQFGKLGGQESSCVLPEDSLSLVFLKAADDKETDTESKKAMELGDQEGLYALRKDPIPLESSRMTVDEKIMNSKSPEPKKSYIEESSHALVQSSITKLASDKKIDLENERNVKLSNQGNAHGSLLHKPLALPLPKSPSESWLKRTLPTISSRNTTYSSRSSLAARGSQVSKASNLDPKWETIVKTSNVHHGHLRFSEELLTPIPEA